MRKRYLALLAPLAVYEFVTFVLPNVVFVRNSFYTSTGPAQVGGSLTLTNYATLFTDPSYRSAFSLSFVIVLAITVGCIILGYPVSYVIARWRTWGAVLMVAVTGLAFTSAVVRTMGWLMLLSNGGPLVQLAKLVGIQLSVLGTPSAVVIGMVQVELPYMILSCVPLLLGIPPQLEEAARGLGMGGLRTMVRVILPLSWPGILAGSLLVVATSAASFTTPAILGGNLVPFVPILIDQQMTTSLDYPLAAALGVVLAVMVLAISIIASASGGKQYGARG